MLDREDNAERCFGTGLRWAQQWGLNTVAGPIAAGSRRSPNAVVTTPSPAAATGV